MENNLVTSKEIIKKTNISRATLNNYVKYGILPRPLVRTPQQRDEGPTKIGYFPTWVIERVRDVQAMKRGGKTMEEIVSVLSAETVKDNEDTEESFLPERPHSNRESEIRESMHHSTPSFLSVCVLAADLENSAKIRAELPSAEYFELINRLWQDMDEIFHSYNGVRVTHEGSGILHCFVKKAAVNYITNGLKCALKVLEIIRIISNEWQMRKGWTNELYMNMGMDEGRAYLGTIQTPRNLELAALGDSITRAVCLSSMAGHGGVYATKSMMNRLDEEELKSIVYGVKRRHPEKGEIFVEKSFSRIFDLLNPGGTECDRYMDMDMGAVTEIISMK
ncbi:MAG TPA: hypothetical protein ENN79_01750 [Desulfobacteraceae bacterium]|nr:hypothetical protein [Desulfobacteraceae bacterium]